MIPAASPHSRCDRPRRLGGEASSRKSSPLILEAHLGQGGQVGGALVEDDGVDDRVFRRRFVEIDAQVDLLPADELHDGEGDPLGQVAARLAGIGAVEVAGLDAGQRLARRG